MPARRSPVITTAAPMFSRARTLMASSTVSSGLHAITRARGLEPQQFGIRSSSLDLLARRCHGRVTCSGSSGPPPPSGRHPDDVLGRVLDVAGLAVHAVLGVDLQPRRARPPSRFRTPQQDSSASRARRKPSGSRRSGTAGSLSVRCAGWSSSWLVLETNTEESRSKVSTPSGFGYAIGVQSDLGRSVSWSACAWVSVHGALPRKTTWSMPTISAPA